MVWTVLWWSGNGRYCFVQLSTLVCSVSDLQSIPYSGGCPTYTIFSELYIEYCLCMFPYGLSCPVWCLGSFSGDFLLCSVTYLFVLGYCSDDVCSLLIGVFELRIGVNSDTPFDSQSCIRRCYFVIFCDPVSSFEFRRYAVGRETYFLR